MWPHLHANSPSHKFPLKWQDLPSNIFQTMVNVTGTFTIALQHLFGWNPVISIWIYVIQNIYVKVWSHKILSFQGSAWLGVLREGKKSSPDRLHSCSSSLHWPTESCLVWKGLLCELYFMHHYTIDSGPCFAKRDFREMFPSGFLAAPHFKCSSCFHEKTILCLCGGTWWECLFSGR